MCLELRGIELQQEEKSQPAGHLRGKTEESLSQCQLAAEVNAPNGELQCAIKSPGEGSRWRDGHTDA